MSRFQGIERATYEPRLVDGAEAAVVVPVGEPVDAPLEMIVLIAVEGAPVCPSGHRPKHSDAVRANHVAHVFPEGVADRFAVGWPVVGG